MVARTMGQASASRQEDNDLDELQLRKIRSFLQSEYNERRFLNELHLWERQARLHGST